MPKDDVRWPDPGEVAGVRSGEFVRLRSAQSRSWVGQALGEATSSPPQLSVVTPGRFSEIAGLGSGSFSFASYLSSFGFSSVEGNVVNTGQGKAIATATGYLHLFYLLSKPGPGSETGHFLCYLAV